MGKLADALVAFVRVNRGVTIPDIAARFCWSVTFARWAVHQVPSLEFYDGNRVRVREEAPRS